tara:strand:- start:51 stop:428 length:378 start_codon:yes stop_codon:yes gene_type:complete
MSYGGRGLCRKCYDHERREGRLDEWNCHKPTITQACNLALQACMMVGLTKVCEDLSIPKKIMTEWARTRVPKHKNPQLREYLARLEKLMGDGFSACEDRERLFKNKQPAMSAWRADGERGIVTWE